MAAETRTSSDHGEIRRWVEEQGGWPARVRETDGEGGLGAPRIDFPGGGDDRLEHVSWDEWFDAFEDADLALRYREQEASGDDGALAELVSR